MSLYLNGTLDDCHNVMYVQQVRQPEVTAFRSPGVFSPGDSRQAGEMAPSRARGARVDVSVALLRSGGVSAGGSGYR